MVPRIPQPHPPILALQLLLEGGEVRGFGGVVVVTLINDRMAISLSLHHWEKMNLLTGVLGLLELVNTLCISVLSK